MSTVFTLVSIVFFLGAIDGKVTRSFGGRIVGGRATTIEKHPYQVSIIYIDSHYCGGAVIKPNYIATAAHCTEGLPPESLFVRAGSTMVNEGGQFRGVAQVYQHQQFDSETYDYDIAILRLKDSLIFGSTVSAISLPNQSEGELLGDILGTATGWGRLSSNGPLPLELQEVDLPTIAANICEMVYGDSVTIRMFCVGYVAGQKDTCQGDSGGPFVYDGQLIGITSWGDGCGAANSPGVYTKVQYFRNYIDSIINN